MKRRRIAVILAVIVVAGLIYYFKFYLPGLSDSEIKASGHIEVTEVDMSFRIAGHVAKLFVDEGMKPKKGELLAELEQEVIKARRDQAEA
ncbi:MAG: biotin/lipoyl-binding protein, partial [Desulfobacteraceae bacterium]